MSLVYCEKCKVAYGPEHFSHVCPPPSERQEFASLMAELRAVVAERDALKAAASKLDEAMYAYQHELLDTPHAAHWDWAWDELAIALGKAEPPEPCPFCYGEKSDCGVCNGSGDAQAFAHAAPSSEGDKQVTPDPARLLTEFERLVLEFDKAAESFGITNYEHNRGYARDAEYRCELARVEAAEAALLAAYQSAVEERDHMNGVYASICVALVKAGITSFGYATDAVARLAAERDRMREALKAAPPIQNCNTPGYGAWMKIRNEALTGAADQALAPKEK